MRQAGRYLAGQRRSRNEVNDQSGRLERVPWIRDGIEQVWRDDAECGLVVDPPELPDQNLITEVHKAMGLLMDEMQLQPLLFGAELVGTIGERSHRCAVVERRDLVDDAP